MTITFSLPEEDPDEALEMLRVALICLPLERKTSTMAHLGKLGGEMYQAMIENHDTEIRLGRLMWDQIKQAAMGNEDVEPT